MDAVIFNFAIKTIVTFGSAYLKQKGFIILNLPEIQEDSGDLVSSESITISFIHAKTEIELRFFLCCGKGNIEDYINTKFISVNKPISFIDTSSLSEKNGKVLHQIDFNSGKKPINDFLNEYLTELALSFEEFFDYSQSFFNSSASLRQVENDFEKVLNSL